MKLCRVAKNPIRCAATAHDCHPSLRPASLVHFQSQPTASIDASTLVTRLLRAMTVSTCCLRRGGSWTLKVKTPPDASLDSRLLPDAVVNLIPAGSGSLDSAASP